MARDRHRLLDLSVYNCVGSTSEINHIVLFKRKRKKVRIRSSLVEGILSALNAEIALVLRKTHLHNGVIRLRLPQCFSISFSWAN